MRETGWRRLLVVVLRVAVAFLLGLAAPFAAPQWAAATELQAQERPGLRVRLPGNPARQGPLVSTAGLLDDRRTLDHLHAGFPTRLSYRVELWSTGGFVNDLEGSSAWEVLIRYDRLDRSYQVVRGRAGAAPEVIGRFTSLPEVAAALAVPYQPVIGISTRGARYYYNVTLTMETLSANDLDEVERWLRGELQPAFRGERDPGTAVTRGMRTLIARLIAGPQRTFSERTPTFFVP